MVHAASFESIAEGEHSLGVFLREGRGIELVNPYVANAARHIEVAVTVFSIVEEPA